MPKIELSGVEEDLKAAQKQFPGSSIIRRGIGMPHDPMVLFLQEKDLQGKKGGGGFDKVRFYVVMNPLAYIRADLYANGCYAFTLGMHIDQWTESPRELEQIVQRVMDNGLPFIKDELDAENVYLTAEAQERIGKA